MRSIRSRRKDMDFATDSDGTWAISYGDMITLLLTFFIIFFSTSRTSDNSKGIQQALLKTLAPATDPPSFESLVNSRSPSSVKIGHSQQGDGIEDFIPKDFGAMQVLPSGSRILITFKDLSFFRLGEIEITEEAAHALEKFAKLYLPYAGANQLSVRAYTDHVPVKYEKWKKFSNNLELSALRAIAAMRNLQRAGIPMDQMKIAGWGEFSLSQEELKALSLKTEKADAKNSGTPLARKVILVIEPEVRNKL